MSKVTIEVTSRELVALVNAVDGYISNLAYCGPTLKEKWGEGEYAKECDAVTSVKRVLRDTAHSYSAKR